MHLTVRTFAEDDVSDLISVWESCYARYGGWVARTIEHWRWNILARPGVEPQGIIVLSLADRPVGYAVTTQSGTVLELAVSRELPPRVRQRGAAALLMALEDYARGRGVEVLELDLPATDAPVRRALNNHGYRAETSESLQLVIVDLLALLNGLLPRCAPRVWTRERTFLLALDAGGYRFCPRPFVRISLATPPEAKAADDETGADCVIRMDMATLTDIIVCRSDARQALQADRIVVMPKASRKSAVQLLRSLALRDPWYVPRADAR